MEHRTSTPKIRRLADGDHDPPGHSRSGTITALTLNLAHGRSTGIHQFFQRRKRVQSNLDEIASLIRREDAHVVALQEADAPSFWSGRFDHVEHISYHSRISHYVQGHHVAGSLLKYGTAVLSTLPISDPISVTFAPAPPIPTKGFVVCSVSVPGAEDIEIDILSVHLDFARPAVRERQVRDIVATIRKRRRPVIMMGDLNSEWSAGETAVKILAQELDLRTFEPESTEIHTFPWSRRRLDWVLISPELDIVKHTVLPDAVSDHRAVVCEIEWIGA